MAGNSAFLEPTKRQNIFEILRGEIINVEWNWHVSFYLAILDLGDDGRSTSGEYRKFPCTVGTPKWLHLSSYFQSGTLQSFLKQLPAQELDEARVELIWKAHMALILLFAERNQDISVVSNPLLDLLEVAVNQPDCLSLMRVFSEGFQDLVDCTNNLELGQYMFIG